jgi:hypothetical protein
MSAKSRKERDELLGLVKRRPSGAASEWLDIKTVTENAKCGADGLYNVRKSARRRSLSEHGFTIL